MRRQSGAEDSTAHCQNCPERAEAWSKYALFRPIQVGGCRAENAPVCCRRWGKNDTFRSPNDQAAHFPTIRKIAAAMGKRLPLLAACRLRFLQNSSTYFH